MTNAPERPDRELPPSTPRWVKVFGIIALIVALLFIGLLLFGGGSHGPRRHTDHPAIMAATLRAPAPPTAPHALAPA